MLLRTLYLFTIAASVCSCNWFGAGDDEPTKYGNLTIVWRHPFKNDQLYGSSTPTIYKDKVIFSNYPAFGREDFFALDAEKGGDEIWRWGDYISASAENVGSEFLPITQDNVMCLFPGNGFIGLDMETGKTLWKDKFSASGFTTRFEGMVIRQGQVGDKTAFIKFVDIKTGEGRVVFQIDSVGTPYFGFSKAVANQDINGDTLVYFTFSKAFQQPDGSLIGENSFFAYNITQKKVLWKLDGFNVEPVIDNNRLYAVSDSIYELNPTTGKKIWSNIKHPGSSGRLNVLGDKLIITGTSGGSYVQAFNKSDGSFAWSIPYNGGASEPVELNGIMYFTCVSDGLLWAIRLFDGKPIWKEKCPDLENDDDSSWSFGINADPVRNKLYVASFTSAFCLEPAE